MTSGWRSVVGLACLSLGVPPVSALNPAYRISQYLHTSWKSDSGLQAVRRLAQTPDGYLWLATRAGLVRFDGARFTTFRASSEQGLESSTMQNLLIDPDGSLWAASLGGGIVHYQAGAFHSYTSRDGLPSDDIESIYRDSQGVMWIGTRDGAIVRMVQGHFEKMSLGIPPSRINAILEDKDHSLWIATFRNGVFRLQNGRVSSFSVKDGLPDGRVTGLCRDHSGRIWTAGFKGISYWNGTVFVGYPAINAVVSYASSCTEDRHGSLWIASSSGLVRLRDGKVSRMDRSSGLSDDQVYDVFEDREENLWVGTLGGLDRLSDSEVRTFTTREGLFRDPGPIIADRSDGVWTVSSKQVARIAANKISVWPIALPADSIPFSMLFGPNSGFSVGFDGGLKHWNRESVETVQELAGLEVRCMLKARNEDIWIGTAKRGLLRWRRPQGSGVGIETVVPDQSIYTLAEDHAGIIWAGSADGGGLFRVANGNVQHFGKSDGLRSPNVYTIFVDREGVVWIGSIGGLSWFQQEQLRTVNSQQGLPSDQVFAILDDAYGRLWFTGYGGITALEKKSLTEWAAGQRRSLSVTVHRTTDGFQSLYLVFPNAARSTDGHLWFSIGNAIAEVTPAPPALRRPEFPVPVEDVSIDGVSRSERDRIRIPAGTRTIQLRYTALTLSNPETVRFRYRLEGFDKYWVDADVRRIAFYNNLKPGTYTFRVSASADGEQWRESSAMVLVQLPFFYQTTWFTLLVLTTFLSVCILSYRFRVQQAVNRIQAAFRERMDERTRIARELHDTLLQSFHGLIFRFQAVNNLLPARPSDAKQTLESALDDAAQAITEARDSVHELRSSSVVTNDLAAAVTTVGEELAGCQTTATLSRQSPAFLVEVEGTPQDLHPILRDEIYRITGEAVRNAFAHALARRIEVEIRYEDRDLRVRIRDDGIGIDPSILSHEGRAGHWGLPGMRERAERIGGSMDVWSELGAGTEVELCIPASIAYQAYAGRSFRLFRKKSNRASEVGR